MALRKEAFLRNIFTIIVVVTLWMSGEASEVGLNEDTCVKFHSCPSGYHPTSVNDDSGCNCDPLCHVFQDCCGNFQNKLGNWWQDRYKDIRHHSKCEKPGSSDLPYDTNVVYKCPSAYTDNAVKELCESPRRDDDVRVRVPVSDNLGLVFHNIFCAECHGFKLEEVMTWNASMSCEAPDYVMDMDYETESMNQTQLEEIGYHCNPKSSIVSPRPRRCLKDIIDNCPSEWQDLDTKSKCENGTMAVVSYAVRAINYRNEFCAAYDRKTQNETKCAYVPPMEESGGPVKPSLMLMLKLDTHDQAMCTLGFMYDRQQRKCRQLYCDQEYEMNGDDCVPIDKTDFFLKNASSCARMELVADEYRILDNGSLYLTTAGEILSRDEYRIQNDSVSICSSMAADHMEGHDGDYTMHTVVQGVLSLAGHILSVVCIAILLLVYAWYEEMHNTPGKILMCLSAGLALAQLSFLIGTHVPAVFRNVKACKALAVTTHFFYLYAFAWMNVMSFDVLRTFHRQFRVYNARKNKKLVYYTIYSTLLPVIIVTVAFVFDTLNQTGLPTPKYGERFCWISDKKGLFYFFFLPVMITIIANWTLFLVSVYHIYKLKSSTVHLRKDSKTYKKKQVALYLKLSTVMGLTWIIGYVAAVTDQIVLWYAFIVLNSSQGLFICVAFLVNRKVKRLVRSSAESVTRSLLSVTDSSKVTTES